MKKFKNITLGGIQQKLFNLVLIMLILVMASYSVMIVYQMNNLTGLVTETNEKQKEAITAISQETMDAVISGSMGSRTQMQAYIADDLFSETADTVQTLADYTGMLFASPERSSARETALPNAALDGAGSVQLLTEAGVDIGVGGDGFAIYSRTIKERFTNDSLHNVYSGVTASEGLWSIPVELESEDAALAPGSAFMEFLPVEAGNDFSKCVTMDQLEIGKTYELIITNLCGYYRYRMSDAVQVTGFYNTTPRVRFMYRVNKTVNLVGEKTTEKAMQLAVEKAAEELGFPLADYTMYPNQTLVRPRYEFMIQPRVESDIEGISTEMLSQTIEKWLRHFNEEYGFAQIYASNRIQPSVSYWLQPETTFLYRDLQIMKGASAGQLKPVRVIANEEQRRFFFGLRAI